MNGQQIDFNEKESIRAMCDEPTSAAGVGCCYARTFATGSNSTPHKFARYVLAKTRKQRTDERQKVSLILVRKHKAKYGENSNHTWRETVSQYAAAFLRNQSTKAGITRKVTRNNTNRG